MDDAPPDPAPAETGRPAADPPRRRAGAPRVALAAGGLAAACLAAVWVAADAAAKQAAAPNPAPPFAVGEPQCGHHCLVRLGRTLGVPVTPERATELLPPDPAGHSLEQLRTAFAALGLEAEGALLPVDTFRPASSGGRAAGAAAEPPTPCVLHLSGPDHFAVALAGPGGPADGGGVRVYDGLGRRRLMPAAELATRWEGVALLVRRPAPTDAAPRPDGPAVRFETLLVDRGAVPPPDAPGGGAVVFAFPFRNVGGRPLRVLGVKTDCGCLAADWPRTPVEPDGAAAVTLTYSPAGDESGVFRHAAAVFTDDPDRPVLPLEAVGNADTRVTWQPAVLKLVSNTGGGAATADLFLTYRGEDPRRFAAGLSADASLPGATCRVLPPGGFSDPVLRATGLERPAAAGGGAADRHRVVRVAVDDVASLPPDGRGGSVLIRTGVPGFEQIRVPVAMPAGTGVRN